MPEVSVIMGVYNIGSLTVFDRAMNSVLSQTMDDLEVVICDDGSTDDTYSRLLGYARQDSRIKLLHSQNNLGLAAALNLCIAEASGQYLCRQDADDISLPSRVEKLVRYLKDEPEVGFVGSNVTLYDVDGPWGYRDFPSRPGRRDFLLTMPFVHGALMFRAEVIRAAGGYCTEKYAVRSEDYELLMRLYANGVQGANIQKQLYMFLEDSAAEKRRKYVYRFNEACVRWRGFRALDLMPVGMPYVVKPLVVGLLPRRLLFRLKTGRTIHQGLSEE